MYYFKGFEADFPVQPKVSQREHRTATAVTYVADISDSIMLSVLKVSYQPGHMEDNLEAMRDVKLTATENSRSTEPSKKPRGVFMGALRS
jgi:hypothetical protein